MTGVAFSWSARGIRWFVDQRWLRSGLRDAAVGGLAAVLAFLTGVALEGVG